MLLRTTSFFRLPGHHFNIFHYFCNEPFHGMIRHLTTLGFFILWSLQASAQWDNLGRTTGNRINEPGPLKSPSTDSLAQEKKHKKRLPVYPLKDYRLYNWQNDTVVIDTVLDIPLYHRINFTEKDLYAWIPFQNIGQPLNRLVGTTAPYWRPKWIPPSKLPDYKDKSGLQFAHMPTPYSRLFYLSGNEQGQMLDSRFHVNIYPNWNFNIGYKGLSSLGYYRHSISEHENWFLNSHFTDTIHRVDLKIYLIKNHLSNEENGGIVDESYFENPGDLYVDRGKIPVRTESDMSLWHSRSEGLEIQWAPVSNHTWKIGYTFDYLKAYYRYDGGQTAYGTVIPYPLSFDSIAMRDYTHRFFISIPVHKWHIQTGVEYWKGIRSYDTTLTYGNLTVPRQVEWKEWSGFARIRYRHEAWHANIESHLGTNGHYYMDLSTTWHKGPNTLTGQITAGKRMPEPDFLNRQSRFAHYNWNNAFEDVQTLDAGFRWQGRYGEWDLQHTSIAHYTYYGPDSLPRQSPTPVTVTAVSYRYDWQWNKWGVYPEITWQNTGGDTAALDLPVWRVRTTFYYKDWWFTHHMFLYAGIRAGWFSPYYMPAYVPLTGGFAQQRDKLYGGFYIADLFFNFKVKKFYAFLSWEHFNGLWERKHPRYYSAPYQPYADYTIRLGIIWQFVN